MSTCFTPNAAESVQTDVPQTSIDTDTSSDENEQTDNSTSSYYESDVSIEEGKKHSYEASASESKAESSEAESAFEIEESTVDEEELVEPEEEYFIEEQEENVSEKEYIEEQVEPEPDVPTIEEYLRNLRCSGCRHNCSLLSPRCMNGARKASQAESEYYALYG